MTAFLLSLIGILLTILFVIGTHESAHFIVARLLGVKVLRFSIGFGKSLFSWHDKSGTEYVIAAIPLGGYVKMLDESEGEVLPAEKHLAFNQQSFYKKFLIVLAGPLTNIFCALVLYWVIFVTGFVSIRPVIGTITPQSIAALAGVPPNQEIIGVDNQPTQTWMGIVFRLLAHAGNQDHVTIQTRPLQSNAVIGQTYTLDLTLWHMDKLTPDPLSSLGLIPYQPNIPLIIGLVTPDSPAAAAHLQLGDKLIAVNHVPIKDWDALLKIVDTHPAATMTLTLERGVRVMQIPLTLGFKRDLWLQKHGFLGIGPHFVMPAELLHKIQYRPIPAIPHAWREISDFTYYNFLLIGKLITGKLSMQTLGGPITIFQSAGDALNFGFLPFIAFLAFLSISIGVINLLPIPGLDGGHLFIQVVELLIRRPVPEKVLLISYRFGFALLIFVLIQALVNDILRLY